jgi:hypothetical protein
MNKGQLCMFLAGVAGAVWLAAPAAAQDSAKRPGTSSVAQNAQPAEQKKAVYQTYQPNKRLRTRKDTCIKDETLSGPWCVKACMKGYVFVPGSNPPKCRGEQPLPQGQLPRPEWQEAAPVPKRTAPASKPLPRPEKGSIDG